MFSLAKLQQLSDPEQFLKLDLTEFDHQPFHFYWKDAYGVYLGCNNTQAKATGFDQGVDIVGGTDLDIFPTEFAPIYRQNDLAVMHHEQPSIIIEPGVALNGPPIFGLSYKTTLRTCFSKKVAGVIGVTFVYQANEPLNQLLLNFPGNHLSHVDEVQLSKRQLDCLYYLVKGLTMKKIADQLNLSPKTVEHYLDAIKMKLNCRSRSDLIAAGLQLSSIKLKLSCEK